MHRFRFVALAALALTGGLHTQALADGAPKMTVRDVREIAPAALLGTWKVDAAASTAPATPQAIQLRTFQYAEDGKLLVTFINVAVSGAQEFGNWSLPLDGSPGYERRSDNGSAPIAEIRFKKVDEQTLDLTNTVAGEVQAKATYKLSGDGKVLSVTRTAKGGATTKTVYTRWIGQ